MYFSVTCPLSEILNFFCGNPTFNSCFLNFFSGLESYYPAGSDSFPGHHNLTALSPHQLKSLYQVSVFLESFFWVPREDCFDVV